MSPNGTHQVLIPREIIRTRSTGQQQGTVHVCNLRLNRSEITLRQGNAMSTLALQVYVEDVLLSMFLGRTKRKLVDLTRTSISCCCTFHSDMFQ